MALPAIPGAQSSANRIDLGFDSLRDAMLFGRRDVIVYRLSRKIRGEPHPPRKMLRRPGSLRRNVTVRTSCIDETPRCDRAACDAGAAPRANARNRRRNRRAHRSAARMRRRSSPRSKSIRHSSRLLRSREDLRDAMIVEADALEVRLRRVVWKPPVDSRRKTAVQRRDAAHRCASKWTPGPNRSP